MVSEDNLIGSTVASVNRDHHIRQESANRLAILAAQPLGAVSMGSPKLKRKRMDLACKRASCTGDLEPTPRQMARERLRKEAPAGIVGTNEQIFHPNEELYIQLPNRKFDEIIPDLPPGNPTFQAKTTPRSDSVVDFAPKPRV